MCSRPKKINNYSAVSLFCGAGGLDLGFQLAGFNIVKAYDNWITAVKIYNDNFSHKAEKIDAYEINSEYIKQISPTIIIGGPPCQDYSSAGVQDETRGRADLTFRFAEIICKSDTKWFVMENVERIRKSKTLSKTINLFKTHNFGLTQIILDASLCGCPQKRKRFFLIGHKNDNNGFLEESLLKNLSGHQMTVREYMGKELDTEYYYNPPRSYARRGIFSIDEPAPTIRGVNRPIPATYKIHKNDATDDLTKVRPLTLHERARIQTFPTEFIFTGNKTELEQIIGNAVPVNLAKYVAVHLKKYMEKKVIQ